jgi:protein-S-isoprenylcysteine O-methyltransferase
MTFGIAAVLLVMFVIAESLLRAGGEARSRTAGPTDRGTSRRIMITFVFNCLFFLLSPLLNRVGGTLPETAAWLGIGAMVTGIALRVWSMRVLGRFFTRTLTVGSDQMIVRTGPYRLIRHPGYAADIAMWIGAGLAGGSIVCALLMTTATVVTYRTRIEAEEHMLIEAFGDAYREYSRQTWRLLPPLY